MDRQTVYDYIKKKYKAEPEYLWRRFPGYAVFRHKDNSKWFALAGYDEEHSQHPERGPEMRIIISPAKQIRAFCWSGYRFDEDRSSDTEYVFIRTQSPGRRGQ